MKRTLMLLIVLLTLCTTVFASEWIYAGRFVMSSEPAIAHNVDIFLINHLEKFNGQRMMRRNDGGADTYMPYDVYYKHDHSTDVNKDNGNYRTVAYSYQARIIPLNINNQTMGSGVFGGAIECDYKLATEGVFGVRVPSFKVYDLESKQELFSAEGNTGSEVLKANSAAHAIMQATGH